MSGNDIQENRVYSVLRVLWTHTLAHFLIRWLLINLITIIIFVSHEISWNFFMIFDGTVWPFPPAKLSPRWLKKLKNGPSFSSTDLHMNIFVSKSGQQPNVNVYCWNKMGGWYDTCIWVTKFWWINDLCYFFKWQMRSMTTQI